MLNTINIVATSALPWRTGTAILPLLRAYYLAKRGLDTRLYVPWISPENQRVLFGENFIFDSKNEQEAAIRNYLPDPRCASLQIEFYPGIYLRRLGSIFPLCAISKRLRRCDWLLLEEPEHLNWIHFWNRYDKLAKRVTGIVLTNYYYYAAHAFPYLPFIPLALERYNQWLIRRHCHDALILGNAIRPFPTAQDFSSSGIHPSFFQTAPVRPDSQKIYFMGKLIWEKGFRELIDLLANSTIREIDLFGVGNDQEAIAAYAQSQGVQLNFQGNAANPANALQDYKIFINASRSEAQCTTTSEALGQGKFVIIPSVLANKEFYRFKNCLVYSSPHEFRTGLEFALENAPKTDPQIQWFTWEAAIDRLLDYYEKTA